MAFDQLLLMKLTHRTQVCVAAAVTVSPPAAVGCN